MPITKTPLEDRFLSKVRFKLGCWEWLAGKTDAGYGQINSDGRPLRAHRVAYELFVGPIPEGLTLDHLCRNRACVNPSHLEPVTRGENVRRGITAELTRQRAILRTHCKRGHEFTEANTRYQRLRTGSLARECRACHAMRERNRRRRNRKLGESNSNH